MRVVIDGYVWLDRKSLAPHQVANIVRLLTVQPRPTSDVADGEAIEPILLYRVDDARGLLGVPRGFYRASRKAGNEEVLHVGMGAPMRSLETTARFEGRFAEQETAIDAILEELRREAWGGAFLQAQPAFGKTCVAIEVARRLGRRTLILVHQSFLMKQWIRRIRRFVPEASIGIIQQNRCEFDRTKDGQAPDFVVAMMQSLVKDGEGERYPSELYGEDTFGLVIGDEAHHLGAATFAAIIARFPAAYRLLLTATPRRRDGAEDVFFYHGAPITYVAKTESRRIHVRTLYSDAKLHDIKRGKYEVKVGAFNSAQIINQICADKERTRSIVDDLVEAVRQERKIMVVSARLDHLREMMEQSRRILQEIRLPFEPILDAYTGEWFTGEVWETTTKSHRRGEPKLAKRSDEDLERAERANLIFATSQMVLEALDIPPLDVMVLTTPISDVEQAVGRIRRQCVASAECEHYCPWRAGRCLEKPTPILTDVRDDEIARLRGMANRRVQFYRTCEERVE